MSVAVLLHRYLVRFVAVVIATQIYLAGLFVFGAANGEPHARLGWFIIPCCLVLLLLSIGTRRVTGSIGQWAVLFALTLLQPVLAFAPRARFPWVSAFHPVVGVAMLLIVLSAIVGKPAVVDLSRRGT